MRHTTPCKKRQTFSPSKTLPWCQPPTPFVKALGEAVSREEQTQPLVLGCTNLSSHCHPDRLLALPCAASFPLLPATSSLPTHRQKSCKTLQGVASSMSPACSSAWSRLLRAGTPQLSQSLECVLSPQQVSAHQVPCRKRNRG